MAEAQRQRLHFPIEKLALHAGRHRQVSDGRESW